MAYDESSIESIKDDIKRIRKRPEQYIGHRGWDGWIHCIKEDLQNSIDECTAEVSKDEKQGNEILLSYDDRDLSTIVSDNGRGIPHGSLFDVCTVMQTSGKFNKENENSTYKMSSGENGAGSKCTNALSEKFVISSSRGGIKKTLHFEKGVLVEETEEKIKKNIQGTCSYMKPDYEILGKIKSKPQSVLDLAETMNYLSRVKIKYHYISKNGKETNIEFNHKNGLLDLIDSLLENPITKPLYFKVYDEKAGMELEVAFAYDPENTLIEKSDDNFLILSYVNFCTTFNHGTHVDGLKAGISNYFMKYIKENILNKKELKDLNINGEDCRNGLVAVIHLKMRRSSFVGQMKEKLGSPEAKPFVQNTINSSLKEFFKAENKNQNTIKKIGSYIRDMAKIRNNNNKQKKLVVNKEYSNTFSEKSLRKWSGKATMRGKMPIEVFIIEGDSADIKGVMDNRFQESIKLRGVPKNGVGVSLVQMLDNEEAKTIITVCTDGKMKLKSIEDCPIDKLIILSDADKMSA